MRALDFEDIPALPSVDDRPLAETRRRWINLASCVDELESLVLFNQTVHECHANGLSRLADEANRWDHASTHLVDIFDMTHFAGLIDLAFRERPALAAFDGPCQNELVENFRRLDVLQLENARLAGGLAHIRRLPAANTGNGQIGILWREFEKKGRFLPIRKLMAKAGTAIQVVKPVFMMSPLSIANFVPPGSLTV